MPGTLGAPDPIVPPSELVLAHTREQLVKARAELSDGDVAVVMTLGALHEGHAELIRQARLRAAHVIVTIFLNPLQFGHGEDLSRYPRTIDDDLVICRREGVDIVFAPSPDVVYPTGEPGVRVSAGALGEVLEGHSRPGHFDGVLTVVGKLLHLTSPSLAYFGQKDAQQLLLIRRMVQDLDFPVQVVAVPTVRDPDGLALSSRNTYLTASDREAACRYRARCAPVPPQRRRVRAPYAARPAPSWSPSPSCSWTTSCSSIRTRSPMCPSGTAATRCSRWRPGSARLA